tara:strand:+ start:1519 stop:1884 length:366 start_codon:yes stop_codon:yes gene_type:complete
MKYKIRSYERYSAVNVTNPIELNVEEFKNSTIPYEGNSEEEFLQYILTNTIYDEDVFTGMGLPKETVDTLYGLFVDRDWENLHDSRNKGADEGYEVVKLDEDNRRNYDWYETVCETDDLQW